MLGQSIELNQKGVLYSSAGRRLAQVGGSEGGSGGSRGVHVCWVSG